eukprot:scaffold48_cov311-Pinguiococcus_pyrenoidosus.AAC.138
MSPWLCLCRASASRKSPKQGWHSLEGSPAPGYRIGLGRAEGALEGNRQGFTTRKEEEEGILTWEVPKRRRRKAISAVAENQKTNHPPDSCRTAIQSCHQPFHRCD